MKQVLHRHSTLAAFVCALAICVLAGRLTQWNVVAIAVAFLVPFFVLPRWFYGRSEAKELDAEQAESGSFFAQPHRRYDYGGLGGSSSDRYVRAYEQTHLPGGFDASGRPADPDALRKLAEEEDFR